LIYKQIKLLEEFLAEVENFMKGLVKCNPGELEFHQAVREVVVRFNRAWRAQFKD